MPTMVLNRLHVLPSRTGRIVKFEKDVPTHVPQEVYQEAIAVGAVNVDGAPADVIQDPAVKRDPQGADRVKIVKAAFDVLVAKNARYDFAASGCPTDKAVIREVGFHIDNKEVRSIWQDYSDDRALARMEAEEVAKNAAAKAEKVEKKA